MFKRMLEKRKYKQLMQLESEKMQAASTGRTDSSIPDFTKQVFSAPVAFSEAYQGYQEGHFIGWLGKHVINKGEVDEGFIAILEHYKQACYVDQGYLGFHTCEICNDYNDRGEFIIDTGELIYYMPNMVIHYIKDHGYCPPTKFIDDVTRNFEHNQINV